MKTKRTGDISFHAIEKLPNGLTEIKHTEKFVYGEGEASNHFHILTAPSKTSFKVYTDAFDNKYYVLDEDCVLTHELGTSGKTADHQPITIKKGMYKQVQEREVDIFSKCVRKVQD